MDFVVNKFWYRRGNNFTNGTDWSDNAVRRRFISKVCFILVCQLIFTTLVGTICLMEEPIKIFLLKNDYIVYIGLGGATIVSIMLLCCIQLARKPPLNYILLAIHTLCMCLMVSTVSVRYDTDMVLYAVSVTVAIIFTLILFANFMPCDLTGFGPYLCVLSMLVMMLGLLIISVESRTLTYVYVCVALLLFSLYFVYDVQLMIGKNSNQFSEKDYIIAALCVYTDIIQIFMHVLALLGLIDDS